ncbi:MAG: hypothetical protein CNLJKLNK_00857 [Holosporales bacterium]
MAGKIFEELFQTDDSLKAIEVKAFEAKTAAEIGAEYLSCRPQMPEQEQGSAASSQGPNGVSAFYET